MSLLAPYDSIEDADDAVHSAAQKQVSAEMSIKNDETVGRLKSEKTTRTRLVRLPSGRYVTETRLLTPPPRQKPRDRFYVIDTDEDYNYCIQCNECYKPEPECNC
jgi:hypothetical protein